MSKAFVILTRKVLSLSGGPESATEDDAPVAPQVVFDLGVPVLGICYGMQTMAAQLGGEVVTSTTVSLVTQKCVRVVTLHC